MISYSELVADVLDIDPEQVQDTVSPASHAAWTSLKHLQLVAAVEENYGIRLSLAEIRSLTSLAQLRRILREHGALV
jgi:acyl carrier protein